MKVEETLSLGEGKLQEPIRNCPFKKREGKRSEQRAEWISVKMGVASQLNSKKIAVNSTIFGNSSQVELLISCLFIFIYMNL